MTDAPGFWTVALYFRQRYYGGPEEGGWWYDQDTLVPADDSLMSDWVTKCATVWLNEDLAYETARELNLELEHQVNRARPSLYSVLSQGIYVACVYPGWPPVQDPATRPHYE